MYMRERNIQIPGLRQQAKQQEVKSTWGRSEKKKRQTMKMVSRERRKWTEGDGGAVSLIENSTAT